jgi:hypothetical protein
VLVVHILSVVTSSRAFTDGFTFLLRPDFTGLLADFLVAMFVSSIAIWFACQHLFKCNSRTRPRAPGTVPYYAEATQLKTSSAALGARYELSAC